MPIPRHKGMIVPQNELPPGLLGRTPAPVQGGLLGGPKLSVGLLGLGAGLLSASGPSRVPISFGQAAGQGLLGMNQNLQQFQQNEMQQRRMGLLDREIDLKEQDMALKEYGLLNPKREIRTDRHGVPRYLDNGEPAFPNVQDKPDTTQYGATQLDGNGRPYALNKTTGQIEYLQTPDNFVPRTKSPLGLVTMPDGTTFQIGGSGNLNSSLGTPAKNQLEKNLIEVSDGLASIKDIQEQFDPKYQTFSYRLDNLFSKAKEIAGGDLDPQQQKELEEYSSFMSSSIENINNYIQQVTGAAMGIDEAKRIRLVPPDPGEGLIPANSPTQFKSKLDRTVRKLEASQLRYEYLLSKGSLVRGQRGFSDQLAYQYPLKEFEMAMEAMADGADKQSILMMLDQRVNQND